MQENILNPSYFKSAGLLLIYLLKENLWLLLAFFCYFAQLYVTILSLVMEHFNLYPLHVDFLKRTFFFERLVAIGQIVMNVESGDPGLHSSFVNHWLILEVSVSLSVNGGSIYPTCRDTGTFKSDNNKSYYLLSAYYVLITVHSYLQMIIQISQPSQ